MKDKVRVVAAAWTHVAAPDSWTRWLVRLSAPPQDDYKFLCKHFVDKILSKERDRVSFTATTQGKVKKYVKSFFEDLPQRVFDRRAFESGHSKSKGKASA